MKTINALIFSLAIVGSAFLLGNAYMQRSQTKGTVNVKGLGTIDFTSDLIVWEGSFDAANVEMQGAYSELNRNKETIKNYLISKGIAAESIVFEAIRTSYVYEDNYSPEGKYIGQKKIGFRLSQDVKITSHDVETVEKVSREVTELLNQGINFYSNPPSYYYTKLADLKLELIEKATDDAYTRAEKIAKNSGSKLGKLIDARMGIFQITGQNSNEDYTWGGAFNTSSKLKTASITVNLEYEVR